MWDQKPWEDKLRAAIRNKVKQEGGVPFDQIDAETERRLQAVLDMEVPTDAELRAMQARGEIPSDEVLARADT
jgi:hypothetical protein